MQVVSRQKPFGNNRNRQNKSASRICQGAVTPYFGLLDHVSCLGPLGARLGGFCLVIDFLVKQTLFCCNCRRQGRLL